jgi:hypothetical protein
MAAIAEFTIRLEGVPALPDTLEGGEWMDQQQQFFSKYIGLLRYNLGLPTASVSNRLFYEPDPYDELIEDMYEGEVLICPECYREWGRTNAGSEDDE